MILFEEFDDVKSISDVKRLVAIEVDKTNPEDGKIVEAQIKSSIRVWSLLYKILKMLYKAKLDNQIEFNSANYYERHLYNEGYKRALLDVAHRIPDLDKIKGDT